MKTVLSFKKNGGPQYPFFFPVAVFAFLFFAVALPKLHAEENVKIKILAVNPSSTQVLKTTIEQYLPPEVGIEDVSSQEGVEVKYDSKKRAYLISKAVELQPSETQTIEVQVRNVWVVAPEEIEAVKLQLKQNMEALSRTKYADTGKLLFEKASEVLAQIEENQLKAIPIKQRIELYRLNIRQIEDLKQNALSLEAMRRLEEEKKSGIREVKFFVAAQNPANEEKKLVVRSELPRDIEPSDVLDKGSFSLVFDNQKMLYILEQEDTLGPREEKKYQITLRDIWYIPKSELEYLKSEIKKLLPLFEKSSYAEFANKQGIAANQAIDAILALQAEVSSSSFLEDRIRAHVLNSQREKFAKRKIKELQDLLSEVTLKADENEIINEIKHLVQKISEAQKLVVMAMGLHSKKSIILILFLGIVLFLAILTAIFYGTWLKKLQENKWVASPKKEVKADAPKGEKT